MGLKVSFESGKKVQSQGLFQKAEKVIPGGISANIKYFPPHPIVMEKASGSKLFDVDGEEYIDYSLCYGALITGHGHERITSATTKYMESIGTAIFGTPHKLEITMAEKLIELYPGIDMVRYTNSGLEATLFAIRLAIAYTGRGRIGKFEGHYHGGYNEVLVSVNPNEQEAGEAGNPSAVPESKGIPEDKLNQTIILPFNDLKATEQLLRKHAHELAAVILEPVQGGFIPAEPEFLEGLRKITKELGILLIFDEVKTGFRVHLGGAQSVYNITPDLTALGKVLGGGFPVGAIGGRRDIMMLSAPNAGSDVFSVDGKSHKKNDVVFHSGTYNGHPIVLSAGLETIQLLEEDNTMGQLFMQTNKLRKQLEELYASYDIPMQTIGMGSIFNIVLSSNPIRNYRDMWQADNKLREAIDRELLDLGVFLKPLNRYSMSTVHDNIDIRKTVDAHEKAIRRLYY
ncbi:aminotransferase class III-fold pyridoxal phosphate-dependent enzyme [Virgibacillus sp. MSJ-26]|uniref:aspartate aminotransferase family protein n=1 Tax=Virgibacillus sp. MSJ-26 TaxID=2841522 RepID=UPI001C114FD5|nr:aminotransferase class III-fold pyridoxal phosphate-dependent enzyme [Virgibacillus sp. MSJ-26]MBU5466832.1 aminotransferase class III-fold pyridoxal phosphate-dependent enzyme [Virgibacillus sp. MSJ-26]